MDDGGTYILLILAAGVIGLFMQYQLIKMAVKNGSLAAHDRINGTNFVTPKNVTTIVGNNPLTDGSREKAACGSYEYHTNHNYGTSSGPRPCNGLFDAWSEASK